MGPPSKISGGEEYGGGYHARREENRSLGKHWITRFLSCHPDLAAKLSSRLDRQRALASNPSVIKDYFNKVCLNNVYKGVPPRATSTNFFFSCRVQSNSIIYLILIFTTWTRRDS